MSELEMGQKFPDGNGVAHYVQEEPLDHDSRKATVSEVAKIVDLGVSPVAAIDAYILDVVGVPAEQWAGIRGVGVQSVEHNASRAREAILGEMVGDGS